MASSKKGSGTTGSTPATAASDTVTSTTSTATTARKRGASNPEATIYWNGSRDRALMTLLLQNPGRLTAPMVATHLAQDASFADEAHLLALDGAAEKVRLRVAKLNKDLEERGVSVRLELRRGNNSGYDRLATIDEVLATFGIPTAPAGTPGEMVPAVQPQVQVQEPVPTTTISTSTPVPQFLGNVGGLIPNPQ